MLSPPSGKMWLLLLPMGLEAMALGALIPILALFLTKDVLMSMMMYSSAKCASHLLRLVASFFFSVMSDFVGRRPFLIFAFLWSFASYSSLLVQTSSVAAFVVYASTGISGNSKSLVFSMICDSTSALHDLRATSMGLMGGTFAGGIIIGSFVSGRLKHYISRRMVLCFPALLELSAGVVTYLFIPETVVDKKACGRKTTSSDKNAFPVLESHKRGNSSDAMLAQTSTHHGDNGSSNVAGCPLPLVAADQPNVESLPNRRSSVMDSSDGSDGCCSLLLYGDGVKSYHSFEVCADDKLCKKPDKPKNDIESGEKYKSGNSMRSSKIPIILIGISRMMQSLSVESVTICYAFLIAEKYPKIDASEALGWQMPIYGVAMLFAESYLFARLYRFLGAYGVVYLSSIGMSLGLVTLMASSSGSIYVHTLISCCSYSIFYGLLETAMPQLVSLRTDKSTHGFAQGVLSFGQSSAKIIGSLFWGFMFSRRGPNLTFILSSIVALLSNIPLFLSRLNDVCLG